VRSIYRANECATFISKILPYLLTETDDNEIIKDMTIKMSKFQKIIRIPMNLFASNIIGPPSVMLFKRGIEDQFDDRLKYELNFFL
jgi:hypothetical protein